MPGPRPRFFAPPDELRHQLDTEPTKVLTQRYGVSHSTISKLRRALGLPLRRRGRIFGTGQVEAALLNVIQPGQWYTASALRPHVPGSRARLYEILARLCTQGRLVRRGKYMQYEWQQL